MSHITAATLLFFYLQLDCSTAKFGPLWRGHLHPARLIITFYFGLLDPKVSGHKSDQASSAV